MTQVEPPIIGRRLRFSAVTQEQSMSLHARQRVVRALLPSLLACTAASAQAQAAEAPSRLKTNASLLMVDYQVVRVAGDQPIDLVGFHVMNEIAEGLYLGAGLFAPHFKGVYGGFTAYDITLHGQRRLSPKWVLQAGLGLGGGAGGRSVENAKLLSGTGAFYKAYAGLGYDFGPAILGLNVSKMSFQRSTISGTQANAYVQIPFEYVTGPFASHGQRLTGAEDRAAAAASSERMLTFSLDSFSQIDPQGTYKGSWQNVDLQFSQYFARDTYWFANLGVGYRGLPLYNQVMGGIGQRLRVSPSITLYGQLALGSGGYAPERINTDSGFLVFPRLSAEFALTPDLGLSLSAGYLVAPEGTSKNRAVGIALTRHLRASTGPAATAGNGGAGVFQGYRVGLFQQTQPSVSFAGIDRGRLSLMGIQVEAQLNERWYIPVQAAIAYTTYLGYPGNGELLGGIGIQTLAARDERLQGFAELMAGTNVHGLALKAGLGLRYHLNDRIALRAMVGHIEARSKARNRYSADSVSLGFDYLFSLPTW